MNRISLNDGQDFLLWREASGGTVEVFDILVTSERRKGAGRSLINQLYYEMQGKTKLIWAATRPSNLISQDFYRGIGFRIVGILSRFYGDEEAVVWGLDL